MNSLENSPILSTIRKEAKTSFRSPVFLGIFVIVSILTAVISYMQLHDDGLLGFLPQYIMAPLIQNSLSILFLVFLIMPSLSISEEVETGTWGMMAIFRRNKSRMILGKLLWQFFLVVVLAIWSFVVTFLTYLVMNHGLTTYVLSPSTIYPYRNFPGVGEIIVKRMFISPVDLYIELTFFILVSLIIVLWGFTISMVSSSRTISVVIAIGFFLIVDAAASYFTSLSGSTSMIKLYGAISLIYPPNMFGSIANFVSLNGIFSVSEARLGEVISQNNIQGPMKIIFPVTSLHYTIIAMLIMAVLLLSFIMIYGRFKR
ncbi:MAG: hypothetical protein LVQ96_05385 [Thermoplasmatales archaeon]|nr:hypothetical protein [Thermoplasmatales archaeon]MCW6170585.1 hypothetical protein [Thermoplasmatales archaeon]